MALHHSLRELVDARGAAVVADAAELRGALDDFLAEDEATVGELNLLVDAVRLGGVDRLLSLLDNGADPGAAVAESGAALARDRGSDDTRRASWAVAALGHALGRVDAGVVERTVPTAGPADPLPAPPPPPPPPPDPGTEPRPDPDLGTVGSAEAVPTAYEDRGGSDVPQTPSAERPAPRRRRRSVVLLAVSFAVVLGLVGGVGLALWMERDTSTNANDPALSPTAEESSKGPRETGSLRRAIPATDIVVNYTDSIGVSQIYRINAETGKRRPLTSGSLDRLPAVNNDRTQVAYLQGPPPGPVRILDLRTEKEGPAFPEDGACGTAGRPGWSPDGSRMAVICAGADDDKESDGLYLVDLEQGGATPLVNDENLNGTPTWVDDNSLIFGRADEQGVAESLWLYEIGTEGEDGEQTQLTPEDADGALSHADWSEDQRQLLFLVHDTGDPEYGQIWISDDVNLETARPLPGGPYAHPAWAPRGNRIAVTVIDDDGVEKLATITTTEPEEPHIIEPPDPSWKVGIPAWGSR